MAAVNQSSGFHVLIIGAGSTGLLIAQYLKKLNIKATVYERESFLNQRSRDWNFGVFWAQSPLSDCLPTAINSRLRSAQVDPTNARHWDETLPIFNGETGELMIKQPTPGVLRFRRSEFRKVIADGLDIEYSKRLQTAKVDELNGPKVTAIFEDGTEATGDFLIGADGSKSRIRDFLLGHEKGALHKMPLLGCTTCGRLPYDISKELFDTDMTCILSYHPDGFLVFVSIHALIKPNQPESWEWMLHITWRHPVDQAIPDAPEIAKLWNSFSRKLTEPTRAAFLAAPDQSPLYCDRITQWPSVAWDNRQGTITLAGDAAHPMTFHRGQGLSNAINDAAFLCQALTEHFHGGKPLAEVIGAYEKEIVDRGHAAVTSSGQNSMMCTDWSLLKESSMWKMGAAQDTKS